MFKFTTCLINMYGYYLKHEALCAFSEMEKLMLRTLFLSTFGNSSAVLSQCKPSMASFMAILGHLNVTEDDAYVLCSAMWDLYHLLLRERHWALIHLAMGSFGSFAVRPSFTELWKFVPGDVALSYNASTGTSIDENGFMLELRAYLQKEAALHPDRWSGEEQLRFLVSEGRTLKKLVEACSEIPVVSEPEKVANTRVVGAKKRKMPDGICQGMVLRQNGLKVMRRAFDEAGSAVPKDRFAAHLSRLEDALSQISSLSDEI